MPKLKCARGYRYIKELGGAVRRQTVSAAARWLVDSGHVHGRVLDYGCGFGFDADYFRWEAFDPYYRQTPPSGHYDTILCNHVLNMLTRHSRAQAIASIQNHLRADGTAWLIVPRNIPPCGKVALRRRIQNYVVLDLPSMRTTDELEIYQLTKETVVVDRTDEIEHRLATR